MGSYWVWFIALSLVASAIVLWPILPSTRQSSKSKTKKVDQASDERQALNDALYQEQLADLDAELARGNLNHEQMQRLKKDLEKQHQQDLQSFQVSSSDATRSKSAAGQNKSPRAKQIERAACWSVAIVLPLLAMGVYWYQGAFPDWQIQDYDDRIAAHVEENGFDDTAQRMLDELRKKLDRRLEQQPDNLRNWYLLANVAFEQQDFKRSIDAYKTILDQRPDSPGVISNLLQVIFIASGNQFTEETRPLFDNALTRDPENVGLLSLGGLDAYQQQNYQQSVDYLQRALKVMSAHDQRRTLMNQLLSQAQQQLGASGGEALASESDSGRPSEPQEDGIAVTISLSKAEHVDADAGDRVFVYARAWQGPPMPLAVEAITVADLPATIRLDNSKSMIEGMTMDRFPQIELVARISSTGTQAAKSGEWEVTDGPLSLSGSENTANLVIESRRP